MYVQLKRYDEAGRLLTEKLVRTPQDVALRAQLGSVLYKAGRESEARAEWEKAIAVDSLNPSYYRVVAGALTENRLLEPTADLYRRARVATGNDDLFILELAQLLGSTMNYRGAMSEYVRWLRMNPGQLSFVQQKIAPFTSKHEGRQEAISGVRLELGGSEDVPVLELLAWLYLEDKDYAAAYEVCKVIDRATDEQGSRIYAFAEQAFREKAFNVAAQAYQEAINMPVTSQKLPGAQYGHASCMKELAIAADSSFGGGRSEQGTELYNEVLDEFRAIISQYPGTEYAARSYFQIGLLQYEKFFDLDGSLVSLTAVERELPAVSTVSYAVSLIVGEVLTAKGDTAAAAKRFRAVMLASGALPDQQDEATYRLAELEYFRGEFQTATALLGNLTLDLQVDYANDALRLLTFLQENSKHSPEALREHARADFLGKQRKHDEALSALFKVVEKYPKAFLVDDALMLAGRIQIQEGEYRKAIETLERLLNEFKETSIALDQARFSIAEIYQFGLKDTVNATAAYQSLLADFPNSLLAEKARRRIRDLRGESM